MEEMHINWYPGHMKKTRELIENNMSIVDVVVEVVDSRIPKSSKNPDIVKYMDSMLVEQEGNKPYSDHVCQNILEIILIEILRITRLNIDTEPTVNASKECFKLKK